jgi:hypothetical protein
MNKINGFQFLLLLMTSVILYGCKTPPNSKDLSDAIEVYYYGTSEIKPPDALTIQIRNASSYCMAFPYDYQAELYLLDGNKRKWVNNLASDGVYRRDQELPPGNVNIGFITARPNLDGLDVSRPLDFVFVIIGNLCEDENIVIQKEIPFTLIPLDPYPEVFQYIPSETSRVKLKFEYSSKWPMMEIRSYPNLSIVTLLEPHKSAFATPELNPHPDQYGSISILSMDIEKGESVNSEADRLIATINKSSELVLLNRHYLK